MTTPENFKIRFTEFTSETDVRIQFFLDDASLMVSSAFGVYADIATYYLAAHYLSISNSTASGSTSGIKSVQSKSVEGVSVAYAGESTKDSDSFYSTTSYGKMYLDLKNKLLVGMVRLV